jgi:short subunit dehydrogenase-like uncharacterized protein
MHTANALIKAAIAKQVHYLDVAAESDSYKLAETLDKAAAAAGVMLLPGCGGSVAMLGCLAAHAVERVTTPKSLSLALHVAGPMSRGSAISATENLSPECLIRRNGQLIPQDPTELRTFDFGKGPRECFSVTLPDLITLGRATNLAVTIQVRIIMIMLNEICRSAFALVTLLQSCQLLSPCFT